MPGKEIYNEKELLSRIAGGDEHALRALIVHFTPIIASVIYNITKSKEYTEEIVQDIFIQVWMSRDTLADIKNINGFLFVLAKHHALNAVRGMLREQQRIRKYQDLQEGNDITASGDAPDLNLVEEAIRHLSPQQQKAWLLSRREGKKYAEIAEEMQLSKESVKKYIQWANKAIVDYVRDRIELLLTGILLATAVSEIFS